MASEKVKAIVSQRHFESVGVEEKNNVYTFVGSIKIAF